MEHRYKAPPNSGFSSTISTYVTLLGFSAGNSDFWRFPFMVYRNGGGAFLIPFILTTCICGIPLFFLEYNLSNFAGKGPYKVWDISPIFRGIGMALLSTVTIYVMASTVFRAWLVYFFVNSFTSPLPWTHCNNTWNTNSCLINPFIDQIGQHSAENFTEQETNASFTSLKNSTDFTIVAANNTSRMTAAEDFWQYETLRLSSGLTDIGMFNWRMFLCIIVFRILVFGCMVKSIKSIEKVMYVTTFVQFGFILVVFIRSLILPGAMDGLARFFKPDIAKMGELRIWIEAFLMSFYTMSIGWGGILSLGAHAKFKDNSLRTSMLIPVIDAFIATMTGFVCFSVLGNMAHVYGVHVDDVINAGMSLGMVSYVSALSALPLPNLWSAGFILSCILTGIDSQVVAVEMSVQIIGEMFPALFPRYRFLTVVLYTMVLIVCALPTATGAGAYIFLWVDWYAGAWTGPICAFREIIAVAWVYGIDRFSSDVTLMIGRPIPAFIRIIISFITPCLVLIIFTSSVVKYISPKYGSYKYPDWARVLGWLLVTCIVAPIPIVALKDVFKATGTFKERLKSASTSNKDWGPKEASAVKQFMENGVLLESRTKIEVLYYAIFGRYKNRAELVPQTELSHVL